MHKARFFTGIALLALTTGGCGLITAYPERDIMVPAEPTLVDFVDPATVVGLYTRTMAVGDHTSQRYVHINYPEFANAPALNHALKTEVQRQLRVFRARTGAPDDGRHPELNVGWQLSAASPQALAVRLRSGEFVGGTWGNSTRTYWYDPQAGKAVDSTGLLDGRGALERLAGLVREQLKKRGPQVDWQSVTTDSDRFDSLAFNGSGDLVVEFDDCQVAACSLGRVAVAVPGAQAAPLLSALGRRAQESVRAKASIKAKESTEQEITLPGPPTTSPPATSSQAGTVDCAAVKCVALTFEDGPGPNTGRLLDILLQNRARATFFTVGSNAVAQPGLLHRMRDEGHLIGNHSWGHLDLARQTSSKIADSLRRTQDMVSGTIDQTPTLVRPPYGNVSPVLRDVSAQLGLSLVTWDVDSGDRPGAKPEDIVGRTVRAAHPGAIILMHDIRRESVDAVPDILKRLRGKGYSFVTVPELYGPAGMQAGRLYRSGNELPSKQPLT
ncbi:polysaccharide deacetylase family protein [Nonomuraea jiangxiensis]|uniref:Peptidoglycan/xylan/chitin deacetylase, PgdA/CDA1 family n=1 Tax=Nonomuraea jiangxiensis TaxID=633440 RepID=A0A1G8MCQ5_9ACTN|nr:polysaccharide deacetylase family protein [Nonomuraea jiangxiensis]SDI65694.1 Peptidoglycan/xylan/chitin deacetylase, PgdA/CDA1 family [Nonomuraea jiangxiensis]